MDEEKTRAVGQWLRKGRHDLRSAYRLYTDTPPLLDTAAYHCQQAAEKALKDYLTQHDISFRKTHLLVPLVAESSRRCSWRVCIARPRPITPALPA